MAARGVDPDGFCQRRIAREDRAFPAFEVLAHLLTEEIVDALQPFLIANALAVRGIGNDETRAAALTCELRQIAPLDVYEATQARAFDILDGRANRALILIVATQRQLAIQRCSTTFACLIGQSLPQCAIVTEPANESEVTAHGARRNVERHQRSLDRQRPRSAHGIDELAAVLCNRRPAAAKQNGRREIFLERRRHTACAIRTPMQTLARQIETQRRPITIEPHVDAHIGLIEVHRRPLAGALTHDIDDRILGLQRAEMRMRNARRGTRQVDRERAIRFDVRRPVDGLHPFIQRIGRRGRE